MTAPDDAARQGLSRPASRRPPSPPSRQASRRRSRPLPLLLALLLALALAACGSAGGSPRGAAPDAGSGGSGGARGAAGGGGPLTVFAAASLTEVFGELGELYEREHPGAEVTFSFAGSQSLVAQVQQGAPADVLVTADERSVEAVRDELAGAPRVLARNRLAVVTERGNPLRLRGLADLARPGVKVVLAGPAVPAGKAARAALAAAGVTVQPVSEEPDVKAVVQKVRLGEADAGIAYATDVRAARGAVDGLALPGVSNAYPAAVLAGAPHPDAAARFLDLVAGPQGQAVLTRHGFLPPA